MNARMFTTPFQLSLVTLVGLLACTQPSTVPEPRLPSPQVSNPDPNGAQPVETGSSKSWRMSPTSETQHYSTLISTGIQQSTAGQISRDSITIKAQYNIGTTYASGSISLAGSIDSFVIQAGNRIGSEAVPVSFPVFFTGQIVNHELQLNLTGNAQSSAITSLPCGTPAKTALTMIQRNLFVTPLQLQSGMTWQDSLSATSCSGSLLLNLTILRNYTIIGESTFHGIPALVVDITEKTLSNGEGSQDQHRLMIKGQGSMSGRLYIDRTTGSVLSLSSETRTSLQIQASGRLQQFMQTSTEITTRM